MTSSEHPTSRLRIQFGLRSLLMAVAFVAVLLSWWTDHRIQLARIAALEREVTQLEGPHLLGHFPQRKPEVIKTCPNAFAAFRDGSKIVCANGTHAELWEMTTAQKLLSMAHPDLVLDVSISPDDRSLLTISAGKDAPVRLWDLQDGKLVREYSSSFNSGTRASPSKWKTLYNSHVSLTGFGFTAVAFSPTGRRFATGCEDGTLIVWDTKTAKETARIAGKAFRIRSIAFSPDETKIVTSSQDHTIQIWNVADAALLGALHDSRRPGGSNQHTPMAFSQDGTTFAFYDYAGWTGIARDETTGREVPCTTPGGGIWVCSAETGKVLHRLGYLNGCPHGIAYLADGQTLLSHRSNQLKLWDVGSGEEVRSHTCVWTRGLRYVEYLPAISSAMAVGFENDEDTTHEDWTTISIVPLSSFQELPD